MKTQLLFFILMVAKSLVLVGGEEEVLLNHNRGGNYAFYGALTGIIPGGVLGFTACILCGIIGDRPCFSSPWVAALLSPMSIGLVLWGLGGAGVGAGVGAAVGGVMQCCRCNCLLEHCYCA
jgi:hypothetical protein